MPQKYCATCNRPLTTTERSLDQIQCGNCYRHWLTETLPQIEPQIIALLERVRHEEA